METINIKMLLKMFEFGAQKVSDNFEYINQLNIFPVPDGDTGTNMKITINGAFASIQNKNFDNLFELGKTYARVTLMNARGNSGVIFSQIIKGFTKNFPVEQNELDISTLIKCFKEAKDVAYKSVVNPVEGTILTVIRKISENLLKNESKYKTIENVFSDVIEIGNKTLDETPNLLPELKHAGVVDSGGYGLMQFLIGMESALTGKESLTNDSKAKKPIDNLANPQTLLINNNSPIHHEEDGHGYCTEFLLSLGLKIDKNLKKFPYSESHFRKEISKFTNSMVLVSDLDEKIVKLHVHTLEPYRVLSAGQKYGEFIKIKIENMNLQVQNRNSNNNDESNIENSINTLEILETGNNLVEDIKILATAPSNALGEMIKENYNVTEFIDTSVYGNPSIGHIVNSIKKCKSKNVIIVIDDSNIALAVKEAITHLKNYIKCELIVGRNFVESMAALSAFVPENKNIRNNIKTMTYVMNNTASASFSLSVKNIKYPHITVHKDDYIGIIDGKIVASETDVLLSIEKTIGNLIKKIKKPELIIIIYGANVPIREVREVEKMISEKYGVYCESINGAQKIYPYFIGIQ
ncbi:DAK2 domain-containing protein [Mycoplasmoides pirum]|uniref:DAK2 domain-containing protein n=1 Tax=Mycoplasmoides pirum TaxID=2122 RepID=UPI000489F132|nr:DAK2 domain-containing protein [Mycoplasmoides pirum]